MGLLSAMLVAFAWAASQENNCNGLGDKLVTSEELCSPLGSSCSYTHFSPGLGWECQATRPQNDCYATNGYVVLATVYTNGTCSPSGHPPSPESGVCRDGRVLTNYPRACLNTHAHPGCTL